MSEDKAPEGAIVNEAPEETKPKARKTTKKVAAKPTETVDTKSEAGIEVQLKAALSAQKEISAAALRLSQQAADIQKNIDDLNKQLGAKTAPVPARQVSLLDANKQYFEGAKRDLKEKAESRELMKQALTHVRNLRTGEIEVRTPRKVQI